ncbi:MAG: hypothetical protein AMJ79_15690 [Phycisphaerae bacterium SM23_30]|nr:MAG: hypothetical protein AMJ79_15690 [Phycisphaerae bacterium SM23_30]
MSDLAAAPGAVAHEAHDLAFAVAAATVVADVGGAFFRRGFEAGSVAPGAVAPFGEDALMAAGADVAESTAGIKTVSGAGAPGADGHGFVEGFAAVSAF